MAYIDPIRRTAKIGHSYLLGMTAEQQIQLEGIAAELGTTKAVICRTALHEYIQHHTARRIAAGRRAASSTRKVKPTDDVSTIRSLVPGKGLVLADNY